MIIQNPRATEIIRDQAGLTLSEGFPQNLLSNVQPVMDMTPNNFLEMIPISGSQPTSGAGTMYTGVKGKRLHIYGISLGFVKNAICDSSSSNVYITITQNGVSKTLIALPYLTLTAERDSTSISFKHPIICDENTNVVIGSNTFTDGTFRRYCTIFGHEEII